MKLLVLPLLFVSAALAQVPAHSVVGSLTIDVADIQVPTPYGAPETMAAISLCTTDPRTQKMQLTVGYPDGNGNINQYFYPLSLTKAGSNLCATFIATTERKQLAVIEAVETKVTRVEAPPVPVASLSKVGQ